MVALLTLLKSKLFWVALVLIACASLTGYFWISNNHLEAQIATLTSQVQTEQLVVSEKTKAAQDCSDGVATLKKNEDQLASQVAVAQTAASEAAETHKAKAKEILKAKPTSSSDADSANALLNSLIQGK